MFHLVEIGCFSLIISHSTRNDFGFRFMASFWQKYWLVAKPQWHVQCSRPDSFITTLVWYFHVMNTFPFILGDIQYIGCFFVHFVGRIRRNAANNNNDSGALLGFNLVSFFFHKNKFLRVYLPGYWWYLQFTALDGTFNINHKSQHHGGSHIYADNKYFKRSLNFYHVIIAHFGAYYFIIIGQPCKYAKPNINLPHGSVRNSYQIYVLQIWRYEIIRVQCLCIFKKLPFLLVTNIIHWRKTSFILRRVSMSWMFSLFGDVPSFESNMKIFYSFSSCKIRFLI